MPYAACRAAVQGAKAAPLPQVEWLQGMYDLGAFPRPSEVTMVFGVDGSLKSMLVQYLAHCLGEYGLYIAADQAPAMTTERHAAMITNVKSSEVADQMKDPELREWYMLNLSNTKVMFEFDSAPSIADVEEMLDAFVEMYDFSPAFLVFDSLMNANHGGAVGDVQGERTFLEELNRISREWNTAVFVIHHSTQSSEAAKNSNYPPPKRDMLNKLSKVPRLILSVTHPFDNGDYIVAIVKNTHGKDDPEGRNVRFRLTAYPEYAQFRQNVVSYG